MLRWTEIRRASEIALCKPSYLKESFERTKKKKKKSLVSNKEFDLARNEGLNLHF